MVNCLGLEVEIKTRLVRIKINIFAFFIAMMRHLIFNSCHSKVSSLRVIPQMVFEIMYL